MSEQLRLTHSGFGERKPDRVIVAHYMAADHWNTGSDLKAYDVVIDGEIVGRVEQVIAGTTSPIRGTRLIRRHKGHIEWAWRRPRNADDDEPGLGPIRNSSGCYEQTRRDAVAEMLGYTRAEKVA